MVRAKAQAERFKRQKIRRPRSLAEAPEAAPAPAPRPPGTHAREIAHTEAIEYRYDPEGDTFDARVVDASEPVVTRWDGDPPARDERDVGRWDVVPHSDGVDAVDSGRVSIPDDVRADLRARAAQTGAPVSSTTTLSYRHDLDSRETTTDLPARRDNAQGVRESGDVDLNPQYQQMSEKVRAAQENKLGEERDRTTRKERRGRPVPAVPANVGQAPQGPGKQVLEEPETSQPVERPQGTRLQTAADSDHPRTDFHTSHRRFVMRGRITPCVIFVHPVAMATG